MLATQTNIEDDAAEYAEELPTKAQKVVAVCAYKAGAGKWAEMYYHLFEVMKQINQTPEKAAELSEIAINE